MKKSPPIRIYQYRPSFSIQLLLRLSSTPHLVFNSSTSCTESHGQLPTLVDLEQNVSVGIQTPTTHLIHSRLDGIMTYLIESKKKQRNGNRVDGSVSSFENDQDEFEDFDDDIVSLLSNGQKAHRKSMMSQFHELGVIIKCLRYEHDTAWDELYKGQCIKAHIYPNGEPDEMRAIGAEANYEKRGWSFLTWFQVWAERVVARKEVEFDSIGKLLIRDKDGIGGKEVNLKKSVAMAGEVYSSLDWKIGQSTNGNLLDTEEISLVDVLLFGHLAEALCDIHLVVALIDFKHLIAFFQKTFEKYFGKEYQVTIAGVGGDTSWIKWNDRVNALNQFNRMPMNDVERRIMETLDGGGYAINMMQSVALHCHDLREVLADAALLRKQEDELYGVDNVPKSMVGAWLHKLRMGGELEADGLKDEDEDETKEKDPTDPDDMTKKNEQLMKNVLREAKRNDELWISATAAAAIIGLVASTLSAAK